MSILAASLISVLLVVSCASGLEDFPPQRGQKEVVNFPHLGEVSVEGIVRAHRLPEVTFTTESRTVLSRIQLGADFLQPRYIDPNDKNADPYPIVRLKTLRLPQLHGPVVFAATMDAGGSDCAYEGALVGEINGNLSPLLPALPMVNAEGGYSIGELERGSGLEFAAWNMIWRTGESHLDRHDHWVRIYRYNAVKGQFEFFKRYIVKKSQPEINFPNLLEQLRDFGC